MAYFCEVPSGRRLSGTTLVVNGPSVKIGLNGTRDDSGNDLIVTNGGDDLVNFEAGKQGDIAVYTLRVKQAALATHAVIKDTVYATGDLGKPAADSFNIEFRFKTQPAPAQHPVVRDVTQEVFGVSEYVFATGTNPIVNVATFRANDAANVPEFSMATGKAVSLKVFAAKIGNVERAYWLMLPSGKAARSVMIVISHGFGQNHKHYSALNYDNPLSPQLLTFVGDKFILWRWGRQVMAARDNMALIMPVRSHAAGGEIGPFATQKGAGAIVVGSILGQAGVGNALDSVNVVTFSSGIHDANAFIGLGGSGLKFDLCVNQDPSSGVGMAGRNRRQYLSGWTTGGPRAGFEFMPDARWQKDPKYAEMHAALGREYLHTWALPEYALALALQS